MAGNRPTILITDDVKVNRTLVRQCLDGYDYIFLEANNGHEALATVCSQKVDLVILDLIMPVVDGFAFLKALKAEPRYTSIPVIVNSSLEDARSIRHALELGCYDYFIKALPREELALVLPLKVRNAVQSKRLFDELTFKNRTLEKEIHAAGKYQRFLLPKNIQAKGMCIETIFHPYLGVGGDFFDIVPLRHDKTGVILADVSGHGVLPAMIAAILKPLFRQYMAETESPQATLRSLNADLLTLTDEADYITAFVAVFDPHWQCFTYANAGHPPPLYLRRATRTVDLLKATGALLGVFESPEWSMEEQCLSVAADDRVLLVTDGMFESRSESGHAFGFETLERILRQQAPSGLKHALHVLWQQLQEFTACRFTDDVTCIAIDFIGAERCAVSE
jgi:serine phosphatase RsbU (regulator of sigma subunit)